MKELALNCTTGPKSWKDPDSPCNICTCLANGVVVCTRVKCYPIHKPDEPEPNLDKSDELEQNLDNPDELEESLEPVPEAEPEPEVEPETEVLNDDANDVSVYKKLRFHASGCIPGAKVPALTCYTCLCILPGVMRCHGVPGRHC
ncbi:uncharacterized protein isoform X2 [Choristoneura fumiferana]